MARHNAVIAGAGPAGAQTARDLSSRDYGVVIPEMESEGENPALRGAEEWINEKF